MSRYIDAEWLKAVYEIKPKRGETKGGYLIPIPFIYECIEKAPTIDIVRCKDCKYGQDDLFHMFCAYHHHKTYADDFCNYGERREP